MQSQFISFDVFLQVQTESSEVARGVLAVHHCGRRDGHEDLVACSQLKQAALVHRVEGVFCVRSPTFGPHSLQQLNGPQVGGFLIDALNQLVAYAILIALAGRGVAEVHLGVQVVAAVLGYAKASVDQRHVVQMGAEALVGPGTYGVAAGLVQVWLRGEVLSATWQTAKGQVG